MLTHFIPNSPKGRPQAQGLPALFAIRRRDAGHINTIGVEGDKVVPCRGGGPLLPTADFSRPQGHPTRLVHHIVTMGTLYQ